MQKRKGKAPPIAFCTECGVSMGTAYGRIVVRHPIMTQEKFNECVRARHRVALNRSDMRSTLATGANSVDLTPVLMRRRSPSLDEYDRWME